VTTQVSPAERIRAEIDELFASGGDLGDVLEEVARLGARLLLQTALEAEVSEFLGRNRYERRQRARAARAGSRNGYCPTTVKTTAGEVTLQRPKLRGTTEVFASRLLGAGVTRTNALESLVIAGFVRGLSVRDVEAALAEALGPDATISKSTVSRVCEAIKEEFDAFKRSDLSGVELDYLFVDGSHFKMHPGAPAEPVLVAWGFDTAGKPQLLGLEPGNAESTDAWAEFLRGLLGRGLRPPVLVICDGGAGLIAAVELVLPHSLRQRCLIHRCRNILSRVPKHAQGQVKARVLGDLGRHRRWTGPSGGGSGHPPGQGVQRQVGEAVPRGGRVPQRRLRAPHHPPALPPRALAEGAALQLHRAHLRRDPPASQGNRSPSR
jgi:transposase-like protein